MFFQSLVKVRSQDSLKECDLEVKRTGRAFYEVSPLRGIMMVHDIVAQTFRFETDGRYQV